VNRCSYYSDDGREVTRILSALIVPIGKVTVFSTRLRGQDVASVKVYIHLICPRAPIPGSA
jgi:hypothetical protein